MGRLFLLALIICPVRSFAIVDVENADARVFTLSCSIFARYSVYGGEAVIPDEEFSIRRASVTAEFELSDRLQGELQVETRPSEMYLKDCYLEWDPVSWLGLQAGQFKKPFCRNTMTSSWNLLTIDHSLGHGLAVDLEYSGRDLGCAVRIRPPGEYMPELTVGIFNGAPLGSTKDDNEEQLVARCAFSLPFGLELGGGLSSMRLGEPDFTAPSGYVRSSGMTCVGGDIALSADITDDLQIRGDAEYLTGPNWMEADVIAGEEAPDFSSFQVSCGGMLLLPGVPGIRSLEAGFSYGTVEPDSTAAQETVLSPMVGVWFSRSTRIRLGAFMRGFDGMQGMDDYTDYILEAAVRF